VVLRQTEVELIQEEEALRRYQLEEQISALLLQHKVVMMCLQLDVEDSTKDLLPVADLTPILGLGQWQLIQSE